MLWLPIWGLRIGGMVDPVPPLDPALLDVDLRDHFRIFVRDVARPSCIADLLLLRGDEVDEPGAHLVGNHLVLLLICVGSSEPTRPGRPIFLLSYLAIATLS